MKKYYYTLFISIQVMLFSFAQNSEIITHEDALIEVLQTLHSHPENIQKVHAYLQEYPYSITQHSYIKSLLQKELKKLILIKNTPTNATSYPILFQKCITLALINSLCIFMVLPFIDERPIEKDEECFTQVFYIVNKIMCAISLGSLLELYIRTECEKRSIKQCIETIEHILKTL